jgi:RNA-directed DNA polymerase
MNQAKMAQKQRTLAERAQADPGYRFTHLYDLMHWGYWIRSAADTVLARPGSQTAGVDGDTRKYFKANSFNQIQALVDSLKRKTYVPQPVRRTYIPKANGKRRPLGIATLRDRIVQEALRAILDPIYESDFHPHSYGFRKGRRTMDAIAAVMPLFTTRAKHYYVIEGDIESYFDTVQHRKLLSLLKRRIADRDLLNLIWQFLKAGVMEEGVWTRTEVGVPQGGVISPLLANVYLNELDQWAERRWNLSRAEREKRRAKGQGNYLLVRFADDFVVVSNDGIMGVQAAKQEIKTFLETELHLTLSDEKTRITHVNEGFEFLGFHIQRLRRDTRWVLYLRPTDKAKDRVKAKIKAMTSRNWTWMDEYTRLSTLNSLLRGWAEYYRHTSLLRDITEISNYAWHRYLLWLRKKHKGSRKGQLIRAKSRVVHNWTRWTAQVRQGERTLRADLWQPSRVELKRTRYLRKGRDGFPHPYRLDNATDEPPEYPMGETGPDNNLFTATVGAPGPGRPLDWSESKLNAKLRDGFRCVRCGSTEHLEVHHRKGLKSHQLDDLETLCSTCHHAEHANRQKDNPMESRMR